jgi:hypothetical protein
MEPLTTTLLALLTIVGNGALTKVGEDLKDLLESKVRELVPKLPASKDIKAIECGRDADYHQAVIDVEPIVQDPQVQQLLIEIQALIDRNSQLKAELDKAKAKIGQKYIQINRDEAQGYQFPGDVQAQSIGGNHTHHHYHGKDPD